MTRAARRILDRARSSAWRRVGMPSPWSEPTRDPEVEESGKIVATDAPTDQVTGRSEEQRATVNDDSTKN